MTGPRIRFFTSAYPKDAEDPAGRFVLEMAVALSTLGHDVSVESASGRCATPGVRVSGFGDASALYAPEGGGAAEQLARGGARRWLAAAGVQAAALARGLATRGRHTVSVGHWLVPSGPAAIAAGGRIVLYAHGSDLALLERLPCGRALAQSLDRRAHTVVAVSADLEARWRQLLGGPGRTEVHVAPMGVSTPCPDPAALERRLDAPLRPHVVVTVGRLVRQKGLDVLVRALAGRKDVTWLAAGEGPERDALAAQAARAGVDLRLLGTLGPGARDALLARGTVFVLPSRSVDGRAEGAPVSLREALVAGRVCIASQVGGVPEQAAAPALVCVPQESPGALRAALDAFLDDAPGRALAQREALEQGRALLWPQVIERHARLVLGPRSA
jgi:glycosyltransferase involved in cell wall biosynthesis